MALDWANRTVVVTGGLGFVGSHFVRQLLELGAEVICLYRTPRPNLVAELTATGGNLRLLQLDLLDEQELGAACRYTAPHIDAVVHCAALDGNVQFKLTHSARILDENLRITSNVLGAARRQRIDDLVLLSSAEVYAPDVPAPIAEDDDFRRHLQYTENGYALSKTFTEVLAELHRNQFGMNIHVPRPTNVYGPGDGLGSPKNRVIPTMLAKIAAGEEIVIWGDGRQTRSFVHVDDLVRTTLAMIETNRYPTVNVSSTESVSILELASLLSDALGMPERIRLDREKPVGMPARALDVSRMHEIIDFTPRPLRSGLVETAEWFRGRQLAAATG